jgi:hypothetical protein
MNVSSSTTAQLFQNTSTTSKNSNLSTEQKDLIDEVLTNYDADSLSASDAKEIVEAFSMAGIEASEALSTTLEDAGFDAKEIGDLASATGTAGTGGGRPAGGPPPPPSAEDEEEVESIYDLLEALLETDEEDEDSTTSTSSILSGTGYDTEGTSFETVLDYTSKIIRLKDDANSDVMDMINEFSADDTNLSNTESQKTLLSSLSEILNKTDNYNKISFYA